LLINIFNIFYKLKNNKPKELWQHWVEVECIQELVERL
jgi:hypothetical protein